MIYDELHHRIIQDIHTPVDTIYAEVHAWEIGLKVCNSFFIAYN